MEEKFNYILNSNDKKVPSTLYLKKILDIEINKTFIALIYRSQNKISIYDLNSLSLIGSISPTIYFSYFKFHFLYDNIIYTCSEKDIIIYLIDSKDKNIKEISKIKGNFSTVIYVDFNPFNPYILVSVTNSYDIKIYDLRESLPISHIYLNNSQISEISDLIDIQIKWYSDHIFIKNNEKILILNYKNFLPKDIKEISIEEIINDFYFDEPKKEKSLYPPIIILAKNDIKYILENNEIKSIYGLDKNKFINSFYSKKEKILIIFYNHKIFGLFIKYPIINEIFNFELEKKHFSIINENRLEESKLCEFYSIDVDNISFHWINLNNTNINIINNNNKKNYLFVEEFIKKINKNISDISLLLSKRNNVNNNDIIRIKKYFDYEEIKNELKIIKDRNLYQRKQEVINNIQSIESIKDINEKFIAFIKLLVNDNTNKALILCYLEFLYKNQKELASKYDIEEFDDEYKYYSNIISKEEAFKLLQNINDEKKTLKLMKDKTSQKEELIKFITKFEDYNENNLNEFEKFIKSFDNYFDIVVIYNMPVDFENDEYFYYGCLNLTKYTLKNIKQLVDDNNAKNISIDEKKNFLKKELKLLKYKFDKTLNYIKNNPQNKQKIENILILTIQSTSIYEYDFGFNLLTSKEQIDDSDIEKFNNERKNGNKLLLVNEKKIAIWKNKSYNNYQRLCLNNLILNETNEKEKLSKKLYNYHYYKKKHSEKYNLSLIKDFYKKILPLKCFESLYNAMYNDSYYPFKDQKFTEDFIDKYYDFIPIENNAAFGATEKFSMRILINSFLPNVEGNNCSKSEKKILREGLIIAVSNHEIGHIFVIINCYMENSRISILTPRKKTLGKSEGGKYIEIALFGRVLETINLKQALYLLNENNYKKTYLEFQEGFNLLKDEDLKIEGTFCKLYEEIDLNEIDPNYNLNTYLSLKPKKQDKKLKISWRLKNDVVGRRYSDEDYEEFNKRFK